MGVGVTKFWCESKAIPNSYMIRVPHFLCQEEPFSPTPPPTQVMTLLSQFD